MIHHFAIFKKTKCIFLLFTGQVWHCSSAVNESKENRKGGGSVHEKLCKMPEIECMRKKLTNFGTICPRRKGMKELALVLKTHS